MKIDWTKLLPHFAAVGVFLVAAGIYFLPQFQGKVVDQGDLTSYYGMSQELRAFEERTGEQTLWTNAMFGGMPTYQIRSVQNGNLLYRFDKAVRLGIAAPVGQFLVAMIGFYVLLVLLGVHPWLSIVGALSFGFTTNSVILFEAGHATKLQAVSYFPLIAAGIILAFRQQLLLGGLVFGLGLGLNVTANHVQMTYYLFLTLAILGIVQLIYHVREGKLAEFGKATAVLLIGGVLALGATASNLLLTYEYAEDTMRGQPILTNEKSAEARSSSETEGLAWDYAMQWSNDIIDLVTLYIPGAAGGGSGETVGPESAVYKSLRSKGYNVPREFGAPLYWGALPFTSGPTYMGAAVVFFFLIGLFLVKGPLKWWLALGTLLTILLSMGKNLEWFNRFFFEYVPLYSKFRTPQSIMAVTSFLIPTLGLLGLHQIVSGKADRAAAGRAIKISAGIAGAIALFYAILGPSFYDFSHPNDTQYAESFGIDALISDRQSLMTSDAWRSLLMVGLCSGLLYLYLRETIKLPILAAGLALVSLGDLWAVDQRYLSQDDFQPERNYQAQFRPRPVDEQILQDPDPNYRVLDQTVSTFQSSTPSYFHKTIGGYHAAKLQRYQDLIDRHLAQGNQAVYNMLNTKYIIQPTGQDGQATAAQNPDAYGNAWLVDSLIQVPDANAEIDGLNRPNLRTTAIVHQEYKDYLAGFDPDGTGTVQLDRYEPNDLSYSFNSNSEQFVVFSEIWYGPGKGWQAYIDGQAVDHIRVNYLLRGLRVPAGSHTIRFEFAPSTYQAGVTISFISSALLLLALVGYVIWQARREAPPVEPEPAPAPTPQPEAKARKSTKRKKKK